MPLAPMELLVLAVVLTIWVAALVTAIRSPRVPPTARVPWTVLIVLTNVVGAVVFFGGFVWTRGGDVVTGAAEKRRDVTW
jgi:hypothetical protein